MEQMARPLDNDDLDTPDENPEEPDLANKLQEFITHIPDTEPG